MDHETKKRINERYKIKSNQGERFWPDSIFKDLIVSFGIFILLILLATFIGVAPEAKADPSDTTYIPRPEWYFLFLFKFLALYGQIPILGKIEWIATVVVPGVAISVLTLMPFIDKSPNRYYGKRVLPISIMAIMVTGIILLSLMAEVPTVSADGSKLLGILQAIVGLVIPIVAMILLFLMSFVFKQTKTRVMIWTTSLAAISMILISGTVLALHPKPVVAQTEVATTLADQIFDGQDLYSINCAECHGDDGSVAEIKGVKGLEGKKITSINSRDVLYTIPDSAMAEVIAYGRPNEGMTPFGKAYGGQLTKSEIDYIVTYIRYSWDDRFELPAEAVKPVFPALANGEVPSYDVHIQPVVKRYCLSCHRTGKENNNYWMDTYDNIVLSGDDGPNVVAGDPNSSLLRVIQGHPILDDKGEQIIGVMPPNRALKQNVVDVFVRWVMAGMPRTAADSAAHSTPTAITK